MITQTLQAKALWAVNHIASEYTKSSAYVLSKEDIVGMESKKSAINTLLVFYCIN